MTVLCLCRRAGGVDDGASKDDLAVGSSRGLRVMTQLAVWCPQVLNALAIDPGRTWKGPWRWFDESMLDCCEPLEVSNGGLTLQRCSVVQAHAGESLGSVVRFGSR
jgi:hypothetical protein